MTLAPPRPYGYGERVINRHAIDGFLNDLAAVFPDTAPNDVGRAVWADQIGHLDVDHAEEAVRRAVATLDAHPSIHQFLEMVTDIEVADAIALRHVHVPGGPPIPRNRRDANRQTVKAIRASLAAAKRAQAAGADVQEIALGVFNDLRPRTDDGDGPRLARCGCTDGFVADDRGLRPCPVCNPEGAARWSGGHYEPGHACPECVNGAPYA